MATGTFYTCDHHGCTFKTETADMVTEVEVRRPDTTGWTIHLCQNCYNEFHRWQVFGESAPASKEAEKGPPPDPVTPIRQLGTVNYGYAPASKDTP